MVGSEIDKELERTTPCAMNLTKINLILAAEGKWQVKQTDIVVQKHLTESAVDLHGCISEPPTMPS